MHGQQQHMSMLPHWYSVTYPRFTHAATPILLISRLALYVMVDQKSFIRKRPFFANKNVTFAKLSWTPCLSIAGTMLGNNASYEDSFTTCQITPENPGSLLDSLLKMQLASRGIPSQGRLLLTIFFCKVYWPTPFNMYFDSRPLLRRTFAELSRKYPYSHRPRPSAGGALKEKGTPGALVIGSRKASLLETWLLHLELVSRDFKKHH